METAIWLADSAAMTGGRSANRQEINDQQNTTEALEKLHASHAAHVIAARWELARAVIAVVLSLGAVVSAFVHSLAAVTALIGVVGSLALWALLYLSQAQTRQATKIQERFDVEVFGLPLSDEFKPYPSDEEIARLARLSKADPASKHDWYVDVTDLPQPYAVLLCQRENLNWDWPLRRSLALIILITITAWITIGIVVALLGDWSTRELFLRWIAPSLPGILFASTQVVSHRKVAREKQQLALEIDECISALPAVSPNTALATDSHQELMTKCRRYQSQIFEMRNHAERVPNRLYQRMRNRDEEIARTVASRLRARLLGN